MQTLTRTYLVAIKDYDHMTTMNCELDETSTSIVNYFINLRSLFVHLHVL